MVSPLCLYVWQHVKLSDVILGTRLRYSLDVDEDVKKTTNQTKLYSACMIQCGLHGFFAHVLILEKRCRIVAVLTHRGAVIIRARLDF